MSEPNFKLAWDQEGKRLYETGIDRGVLYPYNSTNETGHEYGPGVEWNGLTGVTEKPSGAEPSSLYADNIKYLTLMSNEELGLTVEAYTYPEEFAACDGSASLATGVSIGHQTRTKFGMSYRTRLGNDEEFDQHGYKLHLIYGCLASPSERAYATVNDSPEAQTFSWEVTTNPVEVANHKPTAIVTIDSTKVDSSKLAELEAILYGTAASGNDPAVDAYLPLPAAVAAIFSATQNSDETPGEETQQPAG